MSRTWMLWAGCGVMLAAGGYWLWSSGYQNWLAYAMLVLCPLMHLLMHRGEGHHGRHRSDGGPKPGGEDGKEPKRPACH